ncbi:MAG: hypothetical protein A2X49_07370 [Lentisphaerae bacterium GWF2_52_8]|nr:MAG: hypothetical protein A2X49_07370 [Lentisphaerae bacterium GWF2_52_8]
MSSVTGISSNSLLWGTQSIFSNANSNSVSAQPPPPPDGDGVAIGDGADKMSKFMSAVSNMSDDQKSELKELLKKAQAAAKDGTLNESELAASASEELKSSLEAAGVDLKDTISDIGKDYRRGQREKSSDYSSSLVSSMNSSSFPAPKSGGLASMLISVIDGEEPEFNS